NSTDLLVVKGSRRQKRLTAIRTRWPRLICCSPTYLHRQSRPLHPCGSSPQGDTGMHAASRIRWVLAALLAAASFTLIQPAGADAPTAAPAPVAAKAVDFERHVMGLFGRMGCNSGSCHGSFQGRGGFRLSLFGYDPSMDYSAVARDQMGRRVNAIAPDQSLLLLKATG